MKNKISTTIQVIALLMLLIGFFMSIVGWSQIIKGSYRASDYMPTAITGTVLFVYSFFMLGFAYIVDAACIYIEKQKNKE